MKALTAAALAAIGIVSTLPLRAAEPHKPAIPSSYAPQPVPANRAYGAPIQPPIMGHRKSAHHKQSPAKSGTRTVEKSKKKKSGKHAPTSAK